MTQHVPSRFAHAQYEDVPAKIRGLFEKMEETKRGLYLHGEVGTGKTHIAYALTREWWKQNAFMGGCSFWNTTELLAKMRNDFDRRKVHPEYETEIEKLLALKGLLVLDDLGAEKPSEWALEQLYLIVNKRYERELPTLITSNLTVKDIAEKLGDRIASRIVGMCDVVALTGSDRRLKK